MLSPRYTVVVTDRSRGVDRRFSVSLRLLLLALVALLCLPLLMGLGARWGAQVEIDQLRLENASFRAATGELTAQIASLQSAIADLSTRAKLDPASAKAIEKLPSLFRARATGGGHWPAAAPLLSAAMAAPESTFGALRELLSVLESRLQIVRTTVDQRNALAAALPSIWPAHGWLSDRFGHRSDPFTGKPAFHPGLDISTDHGRPVYATASGTVESASYSGAYGKLVVVRHDFGITTRYGHLSRYAVRPGQTVTRGDLVGYVGATGRATGSHLHYEVWANGKPINPLRLITLPAR